MSSMTKQSFYLGLAGVALLVATLYGAPHFFFQARDDYQGFILMGADAEPYYTTRIARVHQGYFNLGNTYYVEHLEDDWLVPPYPEIIVGTMGNLTGIEPTTTVILSDLLFPALTAI